MKKRANVRDARAKTRRSKATKLNRRNTPKAAPSFKSPSGEEKEVARLTRELNEPHEQHRHRECAAAQRTTPAHY